MPTLRSLRDDLTNAFDFFVDAQLLLHAPTVAMRGTRVTWHTPSNKPFIVDSKHPTVGEYLDWVAAGHYSAALPDAGLLQLTYDIEDGSVVGHRLAYVPCPVVVERRLLQEGEPILDVVSLYLGEGTPESIALRTPVRFDFDESAAGKSHPAAHLTINSSDCRIACVAPMHPYRFLDFIFRHFYPELWAAQPGWFDGASDRLLGAGVLTTADAATLHIAWPLHGFADG